MGRVRAGEDGVAAGAAASSFGVSPTPPTATTTTTTTTTTRIYVGGLSEGVTAVDVEKTFSSLGRVTRVEFVRSKGRSFAFMDFEPKSDKSLPKLFASYNGCTWKGGKLKLEKAKEHYLDHLRKEWAEDAELMSSIPVSLDADNKLDSSDVTNCITQRNPSTKSRCATPEKMQLRIYFPKLRKVKPLPFRGTGKHKYSFQRILVPSLPVHFCDCEEHNEPSEEKNGQDGLPLKNEISVMNEEELSIMNSVMNKLLEGEANANAVDGGATTTEERGILDHPISESPFGGSEADQQSDEDNIVTNIGLEGSSFDLDLMQLKGWEAAPEDKVTRSGKQLSTERLTEEKQNPQKKRQKTGATGLAEATSIEVASPRPADKSEKGQLPAIAPEKKMSPETQFGESDRSMGDSAGMEAHNNMNAAAVHQSVKGTTWIQKSAWRDLVGDAGSSTFRISHVIPSIGSAKPKPLVKSSDTTVVKPVEVRKKVKPQPQSHGSQVPVEHPEVWQTAAPFGRAVATPSHDGEEESQGADLQQGKEEQPADGMDQERSAAKLAAAVVGMGQVCTFMRSNTSEKEWVKAKAALSGHLKKKNSKKSSGEDDRTLSSPSTGRRQGPQSRK